MSVELAGLIAVALGAYFGVGILFAIIFVTFGVARIDPSACAMPIQARLFILPGLTLLWPLMAVKAFTQTAPPVS